MIGSVGPKGQVVIPKAMRERLGIRPGGSVEISVREEAGAVEIRPAWNDPIEDGPAAIRALYRPGSGRPSDELRELRREDDELWQKRFEAWTARRTSSTRAR